MKPTLGPDLRTWTKVTLLDRHYPDTERAKLREWCFNHESSGGVWFGASVYVFEKEEDAAIFALTWL